MADQSNPLNKWGANDAAPQTQTSSMSDSIGGARCFGRFNDPSDKLTRISTDGISTGSTVGDPNFEIEVRDLTWRYDPSEAPVLHNVSLQLPKGSRCLLIGANGAGKSTLLRILGGKHMIDKSKAFVMQKPAFHDTMLVNHVAIVAERWSRVGDVSVTDLTNHLPDSDRPRLEKLMEVLDIDPEWRCYKLSDGQRRRVQIMMAMLKPVDVMLLDEITTDLDVIGRQNLLKFVLAESQERGVTVVYSTHIFDGLDGWATHIAHIRGGHLAKYGPIDTFEELKKDNGVRSPLFCMVEGWLRVEWEEHRARIKKEGWNRKKDIIGVGDNTENTDITRGSLMPWTIEGTQRR